MSAAETEAPAAAPQAPPAPKVNQPHAWAGRAVFYWRVTNQTTGEISALPAVLIEPTRVVEGGWELNFQRKGSVQGRTGVRFSERPKAGCWTWPAGQAPRAGK